MKAVDTNEFVPNLQVEHFDKYWSHAKQKGFEVSSSVSVRARHCGIHALQSEMALGKMKGGIIILFCVTLLSLRAKTEFYKTGIF